MAQKRSTSDIVKDWAKYTDKDLSDAILARASRDFNLLESLEHSIKQFGEDHIEVTFNYLVYGAFVDMGVGRKGYGTFKPIKWYSPNWEYSVTKLGEMMLKRYGRVGMVSILEAFPNIIKM